MVKLERLGTLAAEADKLVIRLENNDMIGIHRCSGMLVKFVGENRVNKADTVVNDAVELIRAYADEGQAFRKSSVNLMAVGFCISHVLLCGVDVLMLTSIRTLIPTAVGKPCHLPAML